MARKRNLGSLQRIGYGCRGFLVKMLQEALLKKVPAGTKLVADGIFGDQTNLALMDIRLAESAGNLTELTTGEELKPSASCFVTADEYEKYTGVNFSQDPFNVCLNLTMQFEGTGFSGIVGNFDGAILTYGVIGFTAKHGEIQGLLREYFKVKPEAMADAPVDAATLKNMIAEKTHPGAWLQVGGGGYKTVSPKWKAAFYKWGQDTTMQKLQIARAKDYYWANAEKARKILGLPEHINIYGLLFDTLVQNGSVKPQVVNLFLKQFPKSTGVLTGAEIGVRLACLAKLIAGTSNPRWYNEVYQRRIIFSKIKNRVHGFNIDITQWGFLGLEA